MATRPQDERIPQWPRTCDSPGCNRLVHEFGKLRHPECPPPRFIRCEDCGHEFEGVAALVDHFRPHPSGVGSVCDRLRETVRPMQHRVPALVLVHSSSRRGAA